MPENGTDAVSLFSSFFVPVCLKWRQTALGKGEVRVCVCASCVLAGVSDNEMQQGTKSWGPLFSVLQLHFHSRQSMILPYPLSYACVCVFMFVQGVVVCTSAPPPPSPVSILHGGSP